MTGEPPRDKPGGHEGPDGRRRRELEALTRKLLGVSRQIAAARGLQKADAEDLSHGVTGDLLMRKGSDPAFTDDEVAAKKMAAKAARYRIIDGVRNGKRFSANMDQYETERSWLKSFEDDQLAKLEVKEIFEITGRALNRMTTERREIFLRSTEDGLTHEEIAAERGITRSAVTKAVSRAGDQIRADLVDYLE